MGIPTGILSYLPKRQNSSFSLMFFAGYGGPLCQDITTN